MPEPALPALPAWPAAPAATAGAAMPAEASAPMTGMAELADLADLDAQAWAQQLRNPQRAGQLGHALVAAAPPASAAAALGHFHIGWAELRWGSLDAARGALQALRSLLAGSPACAAHPAAAAALRDLEAGLARREGRFEEALALLAPNFALPDHTRLPHAHCASATAAAIACGALHRLDEALRHFHRALAWAEASGDAALVANAAGNVGAAHYDVYNLDDALRWCRQSYEQAAASGAHGARVTATANLVLVLREQGAFEPARALAAELLAADAGALPAKRGKYLSIAADVECAAGGFERAQSLLDAAAALRAAGDPAPMEWVAVSAELELARHQPQAARSQAEQALTAHRQANVDDLPLTVMRLRDCAARACEALADWPAALAHQRQLMEVREQLLGRSARARRVALEVEHELHRARMQRDAARAEQERLAELNAALAVANRAKTDFLAAASHDLRQPVHALALQVTALRGEPLTERQHAMAERIERCVGALSGLFDGLLDLSRLDAGIVVPQWQGVALPALLATLVEQHQPQAHRKGLSLSLRLGRASNAPAVRSDPVLLERLLRNLLVNAIRYTDAGGVLVAVRRRGPGWCVQVRDSGRGIAPQLQARVFDEFFQVGNEARQRHEGLGLGLAIVARLARVLGHEVTLRSAPGRGTCVTVQLAAAPAAAPRASPAAAPAAALALRVLVIDDEAEACAAMADLLAQWGCEARTGETAATSAAEPGWRPDAALVDLRLRHGRSGIDEAAKLRQRFGPQLPCLIVTGETSPERLRDLHASGLPWAIKPMVPASLWHWLAGSLRP